MSQTFIVWAVCLGGKWSKGAIMKKLLCSTVACAAMAVGAPAIAADMPVARAPAPVYAPGPNWTGVYFGAAFGGGWTHLDASSVSSSAFSGQDINLDPAG